MRDEFHLRWPFIRPPLRPAPEAVAAMRLLLKGRPGPGLQLGVTPEIAQLSGHGVALDISREMISQAWPGDSDTHRAIIGNWLAMPLRDESMDFAFGDGCFSMLRWPDEYHLLIRNLARVLRPGGRLVVRCFAGPEIAETIDELAQAAFAGEIQGFSAFKLRFNMAVSGTNAAATGALIHKLFQKHFPNRTLLARATGWAEADIASIDAYAARQSFHTYPMRAEITRLFPKDFTLRFVETQGYEMAERCPLLVADFPPARI